METAIECSFLIPIRRDASLSDGNLHAKETWEWLDAAMFSAFGGRTTAPGLYHGAYVDPDTHQPVADESIRYIVAVPEPDIAVLRTILSIAAVVFQQKCIYLSIAGRVEFIGGEE